MIVMGSVGRVEPNQLKTQNLQGRLKIVCDGIDRLENILHSLQQRIMGPQPMNPKDSPQRESVPSTTTNDCVLFLLNRLNSCHTIVNELHKEFSNE